MQIIMCEKSMLRIPMREDTLILVRGDRLMITGGVDVEGNYQVICVNEKPIPSFPINKEVVIGMEAHRV